MLKGNDALYNNEYDLSVRVGSNGFSFSIRDVGKVVSLSKKIEADLFTLSKKEIISLFDSEKEILFSDYNKISLIIETDDYTFVPKPFFKPTDIDVFFHFQFPKDKKQIVTFNYINSWNTANIFSLPANLYKALEELFPENEFKHQLSHLLSEVITSKEDHIHVWVRSKIIDIILIKNGKLTLLNSFLCETKEDMAYYILRLVEEFKFDVESVRISLHQYTLKENLYDIISRYVKFCKIIPQQ